MSEQTPDLVTKLDVIPDLDGLNSFDAAIERAISKVNQLDAAIKRVNNLKPASPYAPAASTAPTAATAAAVATVATVGANLVSRTPLADTVRKEAQKVASAVADGALRGVSDKVSIPLSNRYLAPRRSEFGGFLPPPGGGSIPPGGGWSAGRAGGLVDPQTLRRNPFAHLDTSPANFSGEPLAAKKAATENGKKTTSGLPSLGSLAVAGTGFNAGVALGFNALADSLDAIQRQQAQIARLKQTTGSATDAFFALNAAASEVKSDSGAFISTYTNMATATEKLGLSQEETIKATQGLVGALQLGGAETHTINDALYQMGQAFSSDRFGGDEFRSFMEAIGTMAPKVAEAFGTDVKGLREMSQAGKLTSEVMVKAFQKIAATNMDLLKKQGWTWGQTTTVMKNDWQAFLAQATISGEWQRFTDWAANTLIPLARGAEKEIAAFWSSLADESKAAILVGILGAVTAAFIPLTAAVMSALWPFVAVGGAVWLLYEAFVEWKAWLNGEGGTIFDGIFGSFDEFERRYPKLVSALRSIVDLAGKVSTNLNEATKSNESKGVIADLFDEVTNHPWKTAVKGLASAGPIMTTYRAISGIAGLFGGDDDLDAKRPPLSNKTQSTIINSGNTTNTTTIQVASPKDAAETVKNMGGNDVKNGGIDGNIAESLGAR